LNLKHYSDQSKFPHKNSRALLPERKHGEELIEGCVWVTQEMLMGPQTLAHVNAENHVKRKQSKSNQII